MIVGHIELLIAGDPWGVVVLSKDGRKAGKAVWVRVPTGAAAAPEVAPRPADPGAVTEWVLKTSRWVMLMDTVQLSQDSRRPITQQLQERCVRALGLPCLDESAVTVLPHVGRLATVRVDLGLAQKRMWELVAHVGDEEREEMQRAMEHVVMRCADWDAEAQWQIGCRTGCWLVERSVWEQARTAHIEVDGSVAQPAVRRCNGWAGAALCHELAGTVRYALPRSHVKGSLQCHRAASQRPDDGRGGSATTRGRAQAPNGEGRRR